MPEGGAHTEVESEPKLSSKGGATKELEQKSFHAAAQAVDYPARGQLGKSCICGIPERTMSVSTIETCLAFTALDSEDKYM